MFILGTLCKNIVDKICTSFYHYTIYLKKMVCKHTNGINVICNYPINTKPKKVD